MFFGGALLSNYSETAWTFPTPFYRMNIDSPRMVYVYFHRPIYHRDFSMTVLLKIIYGQDTYSVMYFGVCLTSWHLCPASSEFSFLAIGQILTFLLRFFCCDERAMTAMEMGLAYGWPEGQAICP